MPEITIDITDETITLDVGAQGPTGATGATGSTGATGADGNSAGLYFTFSTTTSMADPGAGLLRLNNATPASATAIAIDDTSADSGNPDVSAEIISWDDSTATNKGTLIIREVGSPENFHIYTVTGLTDNSGWTQIAVTHVAGSGTFADADNISVEFSRTGDDGADGAGTGDFLADGSVPMTGDFDADGNNLDNIGVMFMAEQAAADADSAGYGQWWVETATPNLPKFTDDAGNDYTLAYLQNLASTSNGLGASLIGIEDSGGIITATDVEGALAENRTAIDAIEADYLDSSDIGVSVQGYDADTLKADTDDVLTAGFAATDDNDGTQTTGTYTPSYAGGNFKRIVNGGSFTLGVPANSGSYLVQMTNNGSAGTVTTSSYTVVTGDSLTTTDGDDFFLYLTVCNSFSQLHVVALQ